MKIFNRLNTLFKSSCNIGQTFMQFKLTATSRRTKSISRTFQKISRQTIQHSDINLNEKFVCYCAVHNSDVDNLSSIKLVLLLNQPKGSKGGSIKDNKIECWSQWDDERYIIYLYQLCKCTGIDPKQVLCINTTPIRACHPEHKQHHPDWPDIDPVPKYTKLWTYLELKEIVKEPQCEILIVGGDWAKRTLSHICDEKFEIDFADDEKFEIEYVDERNGILKLVKDGNIVGDIYFVETPHPSYCNFIRSENDLRTISKPKMFM